MSANELSEILELTQNMFITAVQHDWETLNQLQSEQGQRLNKLLSDVDAVTEEERDTISKIHLLTNQAIEMAENEKNAISTQLAQIKKSLSAQKAYQQNLDK